MIQALWKSLAVFYNIKHTPMIQNFIARIYTGEIKTYIHKKTCTHMYKVHYHNIRKLETRRREETNDGVIIQQNTTGQ